jgi:UDP-N-acetylglucosamine--N-acetylmuramyl-(pentapeptide) pyrophosphoryl-undecaprenol N-acetylglucosamine transferase
MKPDFAKIIFAGGGTGGHVYPALATMEALQQKGKFELLFIGGYHGIENQIIPDGVNYKKIWISGFQRFFTVRNFLFPVKLLVSLFQSLLVLLKFKPNAVVGTGGYVSGPVVYTAAKMGIPTLIQEQDSYPGVTTRLLSRYSDIVCVPYQQVIQHIKKVKGEIVVTGVPVRHSLKIVTKQEAVLQWGLKADKPLIFIFGGSQGAHSINKAVKQISQRKRGPGIGLYPGYGFGLFSSGHHHQPGRCHNSGRAGHGAKTLHSDSLPLRGRPASGKKCSDHCWHRSGDTGQ